VTAPARPQHPLPNLKCDLAFANFRDRRLRTRPKGSAPLAPLPSIHEDRLPPQASAVKALQRPDLYRGARI
jgi:hypothetical protein